VDEWWETSIPENKRAPYDNLTGFLPKTRSENRAYHANKSLISYVSGLKQEEVGRGYEARRARFAMDLGLPPESGDHDIYNHLSGVFKKVESDKKEMEGNLTGAISSVLTGKEFDYSSIDTRWRAKVVGRRDAFKKRVDAVEGDFKQVEDYLIKKFVSPTSPRYRKGEMDEEAFIDWAADSDDDKFKLVLSMVHARSGRAPGEDKLAPEGLAEDLFRGLKSTLGQLPWNLRMNEALNIRRSLDAGTTVVDGEAGDSRFGMLEAVRDTREKIKRGLSSPTNARPLTSGEKGRLRGEVAKFIRLQERVAMVEKLAESGVDPTLTGGNINAFFSSVVQTAPYMAGALTPYGAALPLMAAGITKDNYLELKRENPWMSDEDAFGNAAISSIAEVSSERLAALISVGEIMGTGAALSKLPTQLHRYAFNVVKGVVAENTQEMLQNLMLPAVVDIRQRLAGEEETGVIWNDEIDRMFEEAPDQFLTLLPYNLVFAAAAKRADGGYEFGELPVDTQIAVEEMVADTEMMGAILDKFGKSEAEVMLDNIRKWVGPKIKIPDPRPSQEVAPAGMPISIDEQYSDAVERGDVEGQKRLVEEAAEAAKEVGIPTPENMDPVVRDDEGNVVPLSERFGPGAANVKEFSDPERKKLRKSKTYETIRDLADDGDVDGRILGFIPSVYKVVKREEWVEQGVADLKEDGSMEAATADLLTKMGAKGFLRQFTSRTFQPRDVAKLAIVLKQLEIRRKDAEAAGDTEAVREHSAAQQVLAEAYVVQMRETARTLNSGWLLKLVSPEGRFNIIQKTANK
jgi:hypothetical protein